MSGESALTFRTIGDGDVEGVVALWTRCGLTRPHNHPQRDIAFARAGACSDVLVGCIGDEIAAAVMVGHDGHRGTVYYVACEPDRQGMGIGRRTMEAAEVWLHGRGIWKLNLMIREGNEKVRGFYEALGYESEPRVVMARRLDDEA